MEFYYYNTLAQGEEVSWEDWLDEWEHVKDDFPDVVIVEGLGVQLVKAS